MINPSKTLLASAAIAGLLTGSFEELRELQRQMAAALFRPLTPGYTMQKTWSQLECARLVLPERSLVTPRWQRNHSRRR